LQWELIGDDIVTGAIVTSARYYNTLAIVRCLGRHGIDVAAGDDGKILTAKFPIASYSKYCKLRFVYPSYKDKPNLFLKFLIKFAKKHEKYNVYIPVDAETVLISKYKDLIKEKAPHLLFAVHDYNYLKIANNKEKLIKFANEIGIPTPKTFIPESLEHLHEIAQKMKYPSIIKLSEGKGSMGLKHVKSEMELISKYKEIYRNYCAGTNNKPLIQEYIPGNGYGVSCLFNNGKLRACFVHKRIREAFSTGGPSVARVSVKNLQMEKYAKLLLKELRWHGMAMVEFKLDDKDKIPKLMEINPRFYGSVYQAIASGVEFPYLLYRMLIDGDIKPVTRYKLNVKTRYLHGDVVAFPDNFFHSKEKMALLKDFLNFWDYSYDDFSIEDLLPFFLQYINIILRMVMKRKLRSE